MLFFFFFFFNDTATTEIYTLSLHDALPIFGTSIGQDPGGDAGFIPSGITRNAAISTGDIDLYPFYADRKSTRLNSSHLVISYAVFCLKKKIIYEDFSLE